MNVKIYPSKLNGTIKAITSKAFAHRAIICACLAEGESRIRNVNFCDDVKNTINIMREIVPIRRVGNDLIIKGGIKDFSLEKIKINESGSTLRFLLPLISFFNKTETTFVLGESLKKRPIDEFLYQYQNTKQTIECVENKIITNGFPNKNAYKISTDVSSQFTSGILFLAPNLDHDTTITTTENPKSNPYIKLTIWMLEKFGVNVKTLGNNIFVIGNQKLHKVDITMPSDLTSINNFLLLNKLGANIKFKDLFVSKEDPDYFIYSLITSSSPFPLKLDLKGNTDSVMSLAAFASIASKYPTTFEGVARLRYKESDRIDSLTTMINSFGGESIYNEGSLVIYPVPPLKGGVVNCKNDHRIAFMATILAVNSQEPIEIINAEAVTKSYPDFFEALKELGCKIEIDNSKEIFYNFDGKEAKIIIKENVVDKISSFFPDVDKKYLFITDNKTPSKYLEASISSFNGRKNVFSLVLNNNGETIKSSKFVKIIIDKMLELSFSKSDEIIAIGGGTVSDLVGFVASVYKRGVGLSLIPTTIIGQTDAAIGAKNAIDEEGIKNCVGSYCVPRLTIIDPSVLATLSKEDLLGISEIIKIAAISDEELFFDIYDSPVFMNTNEWIYKAILDKLEFVKKDPYDQGVRRALNFGHTYGHAIESLTQLTHQEAIAQGMMIESDNQHLRECLIKYGFKKPDLPLDQLHRFILNDKKISNNHITKLSLKEIGSYKLEEGEIL